MDAPLRPLESTPLPRISSVCPSLAIIPAELPVSTTQLPLRDPAAQAALIAQTIKCAAFQSFMEALNTRSLLDEIMTKLADTLLRDLEQDPAKPDDRKVQCPEVKFRRCDSAGAEKPSRPPEPGQSKLVIIIERQECPEPPRPGAPVYTPDSAKLPVPARNIPTPSSHVALESWTPTDFEPFAPPQVERIEVTDLIRILQNAIELTGKPRLPNAVEERTKETLHTILLRLMKSSGGDGAEDSCPSGSADGYDMIEVLIKKSAEQPEDTAEARVRPDARSVVALLKGMTGELRRQDGTKRLADLLNPTLSSRTSEEAKQGGLQSKIEMMVDGCTKNLQQNPATIGSVHLYLDPNTASRLAALLFAFKDPIRRPIKREAPEKRRRYQDPRDARKNSPEESLKRGSAEDSDLRADKKDRAR